MLFSTLTEANKFSCKPSKKLSKVCRFCYSCHRDKNCHDSASCQSLLKIPFCCTNVLGHGDSGLGFQKSGCFNYDEKEIESFSTANVTGGKSSTSFQHCFFGFRFDSKLFIRIIERIQILMMKFKALQ